MQKIKFSVSKERLTNDLEAYSRFSSNSPGTTRLAFSKMESKAAQHLASELSKAGASCKADLGGNIFGTFGSYKKSILTGSHLDTVKRGGNYDGISGIVASTEALRVISEAGINLKHNLVVVGWRGEESACFGTPYLGVRIATGKITKSLLMEKTRIDNGSGIRGSLIEYCIEVMNFSKREGLLAKVPPGLDRLIEGGSRISDNYSMDMAINIFMDENRKESLSLLNPIAYIELHVEQGPVLEKKGERVAAVSEISGNYRFDIIVEGKSGHSGSMPMWARDENRMNSGLVAVEFCNKLIEIAEQIGKNKGMQLNGLNINLVFTGDPEASRTVIPERTLVMADVRSIDEEKLLAFKNKAEQTAAELSKKRNHEIKIIDKPGLEMPEKLDQEIKEVIQKSIRSRGVEKPYVMPSGAGHDTKILQNTGIPSGMIFIPSVGAASHSPEEMTRIDDLELGTEVLIESIIKISERKS